jgi:hypothetical protein
MKKIAYLLVFTLITHLSLSFNDAQYSENLTHKEKDEKNIKKHDNYRIGFGIKNFNLDYTYSFNFFEKFSVGAGLGLKTVKAPIFTTLGLQKEPEIRMFQFPIYLRSSAIIYRNGGFNVYGYGMFGKALYVKTKHNTPDRSQLSIFAELGAGVRWAFQETTIGFELGQFYSNPRGTGHFEYLNKPASAEYDLDVFNFALNISVIRYF